MSDAYERVEVESQAAWRAWLVAETVARAERGERANQWRPRAWSPVAAAAAVGPPHVNGGH